MAPREPPSSGRRLFIGGADEPSYRGQREGMLSSRICRVRWFDDLGMGDLFGFRVDRGDDNDLRRVYFTRSARGVERRGKYIAADDVDFSTLNVPS